MSTEGASIRKVSCDLFPQNSPDASKLYMQEYFIFGMQVCLGSLQAGIQCSAGVQEVIGFCRGVSNELDDMSRWFLTGCMGADSGQDV